MYFNVQRYPCEQAGGVHVQITEPVVIAGIYGEIYQYYDMEQG